MGKASKGVTADQLATLLSEHYKGVKWSVSMEETKGSTCKVTINSKQAAAGQNFKNKPAAMLDTKAYAAVATLAETLAEKTYLDAEKELPKKLSAKQVESA